MGLNQKCWSGRHGESCETETDRGWGEGRGEWETKRERERVKGEGEDKGQEEGGTTLESRDCPVWCAALTSSRLPSQAPAAP